MFSSALFWTVSLNISHFLKSSLHIWFHSWNCLISGSFIAFVLELQPTQKHMICSLFFNAFPVIFYKCHFSLTSLVILCSNNLFPIFWNTVPVQHLAQLQNKQNPNDFSKNLLKYWYMIEHAETCLCFMLCIDIRTVIVSPCTEKHCVAVIQYSSYFSFCWWKTRNEEQHVEGYQMDTTGHH